MPFLLFLPFPTAILLLFVWAMNSRFDEEKGKKPIYEKKFLSGKIGWNNFRNSIRLSIYKDFLVIKTLDFPFKSSYLLKWTDIEKVELGKVYSFIVPIKMMQIFFKKEGLSNVISLDTGEKEHIKSLIESHLK